MNLGQAIDPETRAMRPFIEPLPIRPGPVLRVVRHSRKIDTPMKKAPAGSLARPQHVLRRVVEIIRGAGRPLPRSAILRAYGTSQAAIRAVDGTLPNARRLGWIKYHPPAVAGSPGRWGLGKRAKDGETPR